MKAVYCELKDAQKVKRELMAKKALHHEYKPLKEMGKMYFPIIKKVAVKSGTFVNTKFTFEAQKRRCTVDDLLKGKLNAKEMKLLPRSQEIVGSIMILEVPEELKKHERLIARAYLDVNKHTRTVVKKSRMHKGVFRTRQVCILAGARSKETEHIENGIRLRLHLERVYYSGRSGHERLRIAKMVKKGERVLVMFSGAAPFPLVIARNSDAKSVVGVELNPDGVRYGKESVRLNKLEEKIELIEGDVRLVVPKLQGKFDRIVMPLPKTSEDFLDVALKKVKEKGMVHLYAFLREGELKEYTKKVREICKQEKGRIRIIRLVKCGQFSPSVFRVCLDIKIFGKC